MIVDLCCCSRPPWARLVRVFAVAVVDAGLGSRIEHRLAPRLRRGSAIRTSGFAMPIHPAIRCACLFIWQRSRQLCARYRLDCRAGNAIFARSVEEAFFAYGVVDLSKLVDVHLEKRATIASRELAFSSQVLDQDLLLDGKVGCRSDAYSGAQRLLGFGEQGQIWI